MTHPYTSLLLYFLMLICCQPNEQVLMYISQRWFNHSISKMIYFYQLWQQYLDFSGGPEVKILLSKHRGQGFNPWSRKILHASWHAKYIYIFIYMYIYVGFPGGVSGKESACQCRRCNRQGFNPWVRKIPWRRAWQPTPVFFPGDSP